MARIYIGSLLEVVNREVVSYRPCACRQCAFKLSPTHWIAELDDAPFGVVKIEHARPESFAPPIGE
ncbi:hypothetical protein SEA_MUFASA8_102 [Arthrobacter phage Mufasa8]|uniref:Uncharacterized protein n=1 Tax=Arthrobacter phage Mufasa8 TaxID=2656526 RepID=A0A649VNF0_9CAUD|nr:hypothetical protein HYQ08_gp102 [Arthrobacter phage Mufasa8]QGJ93549.1 hypothetical protein SEA_MUFASA8_102 [Arthrobacter phage Mufasa8]